MWNFSFLASQGQTHLAANRHPNATSMASYGRPSLPLPALKLTPLLLGGPAYRSPGVTRFKPIRQPTGTEGHINGFLRASKPHINGFLWASKPAVCQPLKASPGVTRLKPFKRLHVLLACFIPQPTGTPRPHQWLLMGVQTCGLPALKRLKPLKPLKPLKLCKSFSERRTAQAIAAPRRPLSLRLGGPACRSPLVKRLEPFKRLNMLLACFIPQPTGTPRPHQWLLMGVQACRLPALQLTPLLLGGPAYRSPGVTRFKPIRQPTGTEGHINGFLWACKPAVCQPLNPACRCPKATSLKHSLGMLHPAANRHPKATHHWLLMGVQPYPLNA